MNRSTRKKKPRGVDWGDEIANSMRLVGRIMLRILSYLVNILLTLMLIGLITGAVVGCTLIYYINNYIDADISAFDYVTTSKSTVTRIYYMDYTDRANRIGTPVELTDQNVKGSVNQTSVAYQDVPTYLWQAIVAVEDKRFFEHGGVDFITTAKAVFKYVTKTGSGGGSTITQQLVKNITGDKSVTVQRKIKEWLCAFKVEEKYDKTEILEMYLNNIYLSQGCTGVQAAAYTYFGKDVGELTLVECAALASITQYPSAYDPIQHPENNKTRRQSVLDLMLDQHYITQSEHDSAFNQELVINYKGENNPKDETDTSLSEDNDGIISWYVEAALDEAMELLVENLEIPITTASQLIYSQGYQIITAMDPELQEIVEDYYENDDNFDRVNNSAIQPESAITLIDPSTGDVVALMGKRGVKTANNGLNFATMTTRSPGSSIKPLSVYGPALESGLINYGTVIDDTPVNFGDNVYSNGVLVGHSDSNGYPDNYDKRNRGLVTVNFALTNSLNTISMKVLQMIGLDKSFDYVKNKLHIDSFIETKELVSGATITDKDYSALALGGMNYGVTVLEMTAAYQIFANGGVYNKPRIVLKICDYEGNVIVDNAPEREIVMSEQNACIMTKLLQNVVTSGTAAAGITCDDKINVAGKTGTTTQDNDRWFVGYTPYYVAGVWFGYEYPQSLSKFSASVSPAVKIWDDVMTIINNKVAKEGIESGYGIKSFKIAEGVVTATYCKDSGKLITNACKADPRGNRSETGYFTKDTVPTESCDCHVLVDYDKVTGGIATDYCPSENIVKVGLLHITNRSFPCDIIVTDAQYVWYGKLSPNVSPGASTTEPYFVNMIPRGTYVGITGSHLTDQYNHSCTVHTSAYEDETSASDSEGDEPVTDSE